MTFYLIFTDFDIVLLSGNSKYRKISIDLVIRDLLGKFNSPDLIELSNTSCMTRPSDGGREGRVRERGEGGEGGERGRERGILSLVTLCHPSSPVVPCRHPLPLVVTRCDPSSTVAIRCDPWSTVVIPFPPTPPLLLHSLKTH